MAKKLINKSGQILFAKAKKIIPSGNMMISKNPDLFLPHGWPSYYKKTKGSYLWDLDGKKYIDMCLMGVGTNTLGYSNFKVDQAVKKVIRNGNMSTLNCYEEVELAEKLIDLHPWSEMAKFTRSGGEANSVAIRIARAATGRDNIAFCGYHGWHDWYLAANLKNKKNLNLHLIKNLKTSGVPKSLINTIYSFKYNDFEKLKKIVAEKKIAAICMEVMRNEEPKNNFLKKIRELATKKGIVLIFDECTSGFRKNYGGLHKLYKVNPDIAIFGKALGNGYAINAIIGKKNIMENSIKSFISSTFWTERIGPAAALATLEEMNRIKSWEVIHENGNKIINYWKYLSKKHNIKISISGLPALSNLSFISKNSLKYKTLITQEMLNSNILASNIVYSSISHSKRMHEIYFQKLDHIFSLIKKCEEGFDINKLLKFPTAFSSFGRIN
jgi:glutamate-1-semialdehyde 2,1-aminomutase